MTMNTSLSWMNLAYDATFVGPAFDLPRDSTGVLKALQEGINPRFHLDPHDMNVTDGKLLDNHVRTTLFNGNVVIDVSEERLSLCFNRLKSEEDLNIFQECIALTQYALESSFPDVQFATVAIKPTLHLETEGGQVFAPHLSPTLSSLNRELSASSDAVQLTGVTVGVKNPVERWGDLFHAIGAFLPAGRLGVIGEWAQHELFAASGSDRDKFVDDQLFLPWKELVADTQQRPVQLAIDQQRDALAVTAQAAETPQYQITVTGPVRFIIKLLATWDLKPETEAACTLLGFEPSEAAYVRDVLSGGETLRGRDAKDRIAHLFRIRSLLASLFRDEAVENEWLREPRDILEGKSPMDLLMEGSMENLLLVREVVEVVTGR
jgi:hypothetical protein